MITLLLFGILIMLVLMFVFRFFGAILLIGFALWVIGSLNQPTEPTPAEQAQQKQEKELQEKQEAQNWFNEVKQHVQACRWTDKDIRGSTIDAGNARYDTHPELHGYWDVSYAKRTLTEARLEGGDVVAAQKELNRVQQLQDEWDQSEKCDQALENAHEIVTKAAEQNKPIPSFYN